MNSKRIGRPRSRARRTTVQARQRVPNPFPLATRRLAKRILQFAELPETERTRALNTWLNSAGSPKRNAARETRVRDFYRLIQAIAKKLSSRDRASLRALGNEILAKGARKTASKPKA
jgi:hypothetical protein